MKVKEAEVIEASSLSISYYVPGPWRTSEVMVDSWNHNLQMHLLEGKFLGHETRRVVGLTDLHRDAQVPLLNSII